MEGLRKGGGREGRRGGEGRDGREAEGGKKKLGGWGEAFIVERLDHSVERSIARSLNRSVVRSLGRSVLARLCLVARRWAFCSVWRWPAEGVVAKCKKET